MSSINKYFMQSFLTVKIENSNIDALMIKPDAKAWSRTL